MNNYLKKIISAFLALIVITGAAAPAYAQEGEGQYSCQYEQVYKEGYQPLTTDQFFGFFEKINNICEVVLGVKVFPEEKMKMSIEGCLVDIFDEIKQTSVLDCEKIAKSLPDLSTSAKKINTIFRLDTQQVIKVLNEKQRELKAQGNEVLGRMVNFIRAYLQVIEEGVVYSVPQKNNSTLHDIYFKVIYADGFEESFRVGIVYDSENEILYNENGAGLAGLGFDLDTETNTLFTTVNSWQRNFGFCLFYDIFSYATDFFDYVTKRVKLTYDNKEWMFQIWKGRYLVSVGAEIGVYTRPVGSKGTFYNCASNDEMLVMGVELYKDDNLILKREPERHWWMTGFKVGYKAYLPYTMTVKGSIQFPTEEMAGLFAASAQRQRIDTQIDSTTVYFVW